MRKLLISVALMASFANAGTASAATVVAAGFDAGILGSRATILNFQHWTAPSTSFADVVNFTLGKESDVLSLLDVFRIAIPGIGTTDVSGFTTFLFRGHSDGASLPAVSLASSVVEESSFRNLAAGDYYLRIVGTSSGSLGATYTLSLSAAPVPEPASYAMLLAGLGLLAVMARRRGLKRQS